MIVCCVNAGNYCDRGKEYVLNLHRMITENTTLPIEFHCFTDDEADYPKEVIKRPLHCKRIRGWFNKLILFKKDAFPKKERIFYFDLDTLIISNIDDVFSYKGSFAMMAPYRHGASRQSGIMSWIHGTGEEIWIRFCQSGFREVGGGDQQIICDIMKHVDLFQRIYPEKIYPYKVNHGIFPANASIIVFNNHPKPHELMNTWVKNYYQQLEG